MATTWLLPTEQPSPVSSPSFNPSIVEEQQQQQQQQLQLQQPHDLPAPVFDYVARLTAKHKTSYESERERERREGNANLGIW